MPPTCRTPHTLLALAEAGLGIAVIPSGARIDRYAVPAVRIAYKVTLAVRKRLVGGQWARIKPTYHAGPTVRKIDFAISRPIVVMACNDLAPPNRGRLNSTWSVKYSRCRSPILGSIRRLVRGHRSEIMFGMLVVVLRTDQVSGKG